LSAGAQSPAGARPFRFRVSGMDCGNCALTIEQSLRQLDGVDDVTVSFATETVEGHASASDTALRERVAVLGYRLIDADHAAPEEDGPAHGTGAAGFARYLWQEPRLRVALAFASAVLASLPLLLAGPSPAVANSIEALYWLAIAVVGYPLARRGLGALVYARRITIELLMTIAVVGAVAIGASGEAVTVVLLFTLGEALEGYAAARSRDSLKGLLKLRPDEATLIREHDHDGERHRHYEAVPVAELEPGHRVLVRPGERLAADGRVASGASAVDESAITGEPVPVHRQTGDEVHAGTINGHGTLEIEVTRAAGDSTIAQIARLVEQAQAQRSPAERLVDRFAAWYTPAVVAIAALVAIGPPLLLGQAFVTMPDGSHGWLYRGLALLIIACPCALVISIPVTVVSALTRLTQFGVLVKGGARLDKLARTKVFAFYKNGTLTHGRPIVSGTRSIGCEHSETETTECAPCDELVAVAASVEHGSEHPFAHAVLRAASHRQLTHRYVPASDVTAHAGRGVSGTLNGHRVTVGHETLFEPTPELERLLGADPQGAHSLMLVGEDEKVLGVIRVEDTVRESTRDALRALRSIDPEYRFVMLTGDRREAALALGKELPEIDELRSELLPADKLEAVRMLEAAHGNVAMIGDGINDAPALAAAQLGVAMGGAGSDEAMEVADIVLMQDDLSHLPRAVRISRKTARIVRENIALSLGLKLAFLALVIPGLATLWMAVLADVGATVLVTLNGMRMLRAD
jgi:Zn2+/Cd2+-exporting ATPase